MTLRARANYWLLRSVVLLLLLELGDYWFFCCMLLYEHCGITCIRTCSCSVLTSVFTMQLDEENLSGRCYESRPAAARTRHENSTCKYWWTVTRCRWCSVEYRLFWMSWKTEQVGANVVFCCLLSLSPSPAFCLSFSRWIWVSRLPSIFFLHISKTTTFGNK